MGPIAQRLTDETRTYATAVMTAVEAELSDPPDTGDAGLALAAIARATDLLGGEVALFDGGRGHLAPVLGRTLIETCLWAQYLMTDSDAAMERLFREVGDQQRRIGRGRQRLRELPALEDVIRDSADEWDYPPIGSDLATMSERINDKRQALGFGEIDGWAVVAYQQDYRWRSANEVHPSLSVLGRYWTPDGQSAVLHDIPHPYPDVNDATVSDADLKQDAHLVHDTVALRAALTGRRHLVGRTGGRLVLLDMADE